MDRTNAVIDSIDGALRDCDVSLDAMRWTPPQEPAPTVEIDRSDPDVVTLTIWFDTSRFEAALAQAVQAVALAAETMVRVVAVCGPPIRHTLGRTRIRSAYRKRSLARRRRRKS